MLRHLPTGLDTRPLTMADVPAGARLVGACEQHFVGEIFIDEGDVTAMWTAPGVDLSTDSVGVFEGDALVAGAIMDDRRFVVAEVLPSHFGRGIGTALIEWIDAHARDKGLPIAEQEIASTDTVGAALLEVSGYTRTHDDCVLRLDEGAEIRRHQLPADVTIGGFEEADAPEVHRVISEAFAEWQVVPPRGYDDWRAVVIDRAGANPSHSRVARAGGEVVGAAIVLDSAGATWVPQLAVRADRRRQGIAQELLAEAFEAGRQRGNATGELATSALTGALALYQGLGMRIVAEFHTWEKAYQP
ncbi:GNAT family N-acetyltransferase [Aeromicrobium sp. NPDC092404]|uniref:GNAT family N-acetyltransferase n=1 Tax=Aeromicrobium sp. NPDC092404 TaxID=3154976 RepID=UPI00342FE407